MSVMNSDPASAHPSTEPGKPFSVNDLSLPFVEQLYAAYLNDPESVPHDWRVWFGSWSSLEPEARTAPASVAAAALQHRVDQLVRAYRVRGHLVAQLDPLQLTESVDPPELDPAFYGLTGEVLEREFILDTLPGRKARSLREIIAHLRGTYCRRIGVQFMHMDDLSVRRWLQAKMEATQNRLELSRAQQLRILTRLTDASLFEEFIQKKFVGAKSFSLEGAESLIPLLDLAMEQAGAQGIERAVFAMAHRGRLNVLANILGKSPRLIFREFEDRDPAKNIGRGDVKYHLGFNGAWRTSTGTEVALYLCFNPSHLEYVNPVAMGRMRAKMDRLGDLERRRGLVIMIHGDAAFIGEGIVQETLNLSELPGYEVGGALHVIVNNQIGFTTGPQQGRSTSYASDVAKMLQSPIFHVNGEDPEAVAQVISLAMEFRQVFRRDVVIDMYAYRRRGHNEGDEPTFTQPLMYRAIEARPSVRESYLHYLLEMGQIRREEADQIAATRREFLETELNQARELDSQLAVDTGTIWKEYQGGRELEAGEIMTGLPSEALAEIGTKLTSLPSEFTPHPKALRLLEQRRAMVRGERPFDWAMAELLAWGSLAQVGYRVRVTGQDCERGTFGHRHSVLHDVKTGATWCALQQLKGTAGPVEIHNSPLSEAGVLGFEYGYSLDAPDALVVWEAQFGDFSNCAQVIIDQFISSGEEKWQRLTGLVLLLPHGFEGQGPEHSSARLERFLSLTASDNMQIAQPTTPAQYFHLLRRQLLRPWRKPLVVMTPKSLLRHPEVVSAAPEFHAGQFQRVLPDPAPADQQIRRVLLCSGRVFFDLARRRRELGRNEVAILRVEQLYPLPDAMLQEAMGGYDPEIDVIWVQDEPSNMGAWPFLRMHHGERFLGQWRFHGVCRPAAASPATGSAASHKWEQERLLERAFA
jgi:2-oxoglutarate dehydrogenase E1 component